MKDTELKKLALAQRKLTKLRLATAFTPTDLDSKPTAAQEAAFKALVDKQVITCKGGNQSGKSMWGARNVAWFFNRDHPYLDIDARWPDQPMVILVLVQNSKHFDEHMDKKLLPFFEPGSYKVEKQGNNVKTIRHLKNGSKIIPFSYDNPYACTDDIQMFTAHLVWIDEICPYLNLYEEASRRIQFNNGRLICTYTQKKPAPQVKSFLESPGKYRGFFVFKAFDNPGYDEEKKEQILESINSLPLEIREKKLKEIMEGDYADLDKYVYSIYNPHVHSRWPKNYQTSWRHCEVVDPASSGKTGYMLLAEAPGTPIWYVIKAKYFEQEAPSDLVAKVMAESTGYNIVRRICDPASAFYWREASKQGLQYFRPNKDDRKTEMIKGVSQAFRDGWLFLCPGLDYLESELAEARWTEDQSKIINSTKYHLLDCLQYFCDTRPHPEANLVNLTHYQQLREENKARRTKAAARLPGASHFNKLRRKRRR